jgi:hypothetical protein
VQTRECEGGELRLVSGKVCRSMDPMIVQYTLFILVALLIIGAVVALNRWLYRQNKPASGLPHTWARLDTRRSETREEALPSVLVDDDDEEEEEAELRVRARQNGHSANGHKPLN